MNTISFTPGKGLILNGMRVPDTDNHHCRMLAERLKGNARIILTSEIALNSNVETVGPMYGFHLSTSTATGLLKYGNLVSRVWNFRLLAPLRRLADKVIEQGMIPATLHTGDVMVLVYKPNESEEQLGFMLSYSVNQEEAHV